MGLGRYECLGEEGTSSSLVPTSLLCRGLGRNLGMGTSCQISLGKE